MHLAKYRKKILSTLLLSLYHTTKYQLAWNPHDSPYHQDQVSGSNMKIYDFGADGFNTPHRGRYPISGIAPLSGRLSRYRARYRASRRYRDTSSSCCLEWSLFHDFQCFSWKAILSPNSLSKSLRRPCIWRFFPLQGNPTFGPRVAVALRPELSCCSPWP